MSSRQRQRGTEIKRTGGGRFDPEDKPLYFLATGVAHHGEAYASGHECLLIAVNEIREGVAEIEAVTISQDSSRKVLLDSGAFALASAHSRTYHIPLSEALSNDPHQLEGFTELFTRYKLLATLLADNLWGYIEVDLGGVESKRAIRAELEAEGLRPIPVFHFLTDPLEYFDELASQYDRIALGSLINSPREARAAVLLELDRRCRERFPYLWVHLLGLPPTGISNSLLFQSTDSTSWLGRLLYPTQSSINYEGVLNRLLPNYMSWPTGAGSELYRFAHQTCAFQFDQFAKSRKGVRRELAEL
jgi:hypothetical protein